MTYKLSWKQPICVSCWYKQEGYDREPTRLLVPECTEKCAWCGAETDAGIFKRADPTSVRHPRLEEIE